MKILLAHWPARLVIRREKQAFWHRVDSGAWPSAPGVSILS